MTQATKLYRLRSNHQRMVIGTDEDFAELARGSPGGFAPQPEYFGPELVPPRKAASWAEAKEALMADFLEG